jgi:O-acetyl-ADP-ribose deacetylase (regulator of RNase III)
MKREDKMLQVPGRNKQIDERIETIVADITTLGVDAIVNAANTSLLGGGGVDGAIHKAAGEELLDECKLLNGCGVGQAKITKGYLLPTKYIIHTVGPIYQVGNHGQEEELANCYKNSLILAKEFNIKTIAFPAISTGVYKFPKIEAARIAIATVKDFLDKNNMPNKVFFTCFSEEDYEIYVNLLKESKR